MKKFFKFLFALIIILILFFTLYSFISNTHKISDEEKKELISYIDDIYNHVYSIPEFNDINNADTNWLWDNINQYLSNHEEFNKRNEKPFDYTYEEICSYAKKIYGDNLKKVFPKENEIMLYNEKTNKYGVPAYSLESSHHYQIENIEKNGNIYTVNIIDYTVSLYECFGNNPSNHINFFNNFEFDLNYDNSKDIIFYVMEFENYEDKILENKDKFTSKTLTIEYDKNSNEYHILSCTYNNKDIDIIKQAYRKMLNSFELMYLDYDMNEFNSSDQAEIKNFDEITSIYTNNGLDIYKNTHPLLSFENGKTFIALGGMYTLDCIYSSEISNIEKKENEMICTVTTLLREDITSLEPSSKTVSHTFKIIKENDEWKIDEFSLDFNT